MQPDDRAGRLAVRAGRIANNTGQVWNFVNTIALGDLVVVPLKGSRSFGVDCNAKGELAPVVPVTVAPVPAPAVPHRRQGDYGPRSRRRGLPRR